MTLIGYARVSTDEQSTVAQVAELRRHGCAEVFEESASGASRDRPQLRAVIDRLRAGDTLIVVRIDRLARSLAHLIEVIELLERKGVAFRSLGDPIDTASAQGRFTLQILGAVAEFERSLIRERTKAGVSAARAAGRMPGNPGLVAKDPATRRRVATARSDRISEKVALGAEEFLPIVRKLRPAHPWDRIVAVLNAAGRRRPGNTQSKWTRDALIRAVRRLVADGLAEPTLLQSAPRRSKEAVAQRQRLVELVAAIHGAAGDRTPTLAQIGAQLERQGHRTLTGARSWASSSVKALLDEARERGLIVSSTLSSPARAESTSR